MSEARKVLVIGSGGREHALALRLLEAPSVREVVVLPGNAGTSSTPAWLEGKILRNGSGKPLELSRAERFDLVVIGPEAPLTDGLADELAAIGVPVFGPSRKAAQLEGSKAFMKSFAKRHAIPSARHEVVTSLADAERAVRSFAEPPVVKADGLCAGKGVVVAHSHAEALEAARGMLSGERFGAAGSTVVLEERLLGSELSLHALCDGERFVLLPAAQDHKRIGDGDRGPNTGGMGTYAPAPLASHALLERASEEIFAPALAGMRAEGMPYRGTLFAGLMVSPSGDPLLLEFNVRFGDPETQVLMQSTRGDLGDALEAAARGQLAPNALVASGEHALCVVLAAANYPETPRTGDRVEGLEEAERVEGVRVYHAGTRLDGGAVVTAGGRVLGITARGESLTAAHARAYEAVSRIRFDGMQYRTDIAARAMSITAP